MDLSLVGESYLAIFDSEESMVLAHRDVLTREDVGASLAHEYRANLGGGAWSDLDS
jgi:hypothetical protein